MNIPFVRIHTATLFPDTVLGFDVYLKLADKHILYVRKDDSIDASRLKNLKERKVTRLYIPQAEEPQYKIFLEKGLQALKDNSVPAPQKSQLLVGQSKAAAEAVFQNPEAKENYTRAQEIVALQVEHLKKNQAALSEMLENDSADNSIYQHSVNVSTIAVGLAHYLGAPDNVCEVVGTGGLLHDIGKTKLGLDHLDPAIKLTKEQAEALRSHPRAGCEVLLEKKYISKDVLDIILLHEERLDGRGYPAGVKKLDQIFQVVGLANLYDKMVTIEGMSPQDAYDRISKMEPPPYQRDLITGLEDVLKKNKIY